MLHFTKSSMSYLGNGRGPQVARGPSMHATGLSKYMSYRTLSFRLIGRFCMTTDGILKYVSSTEPWFMSSRHKNNVHTAPVFSPEPAGGNILLTGRCSENCRRQYVTERKRFAYRMWYLTICIPPVETFTGENHDTVTQARHDVSSGLAERGRPRRETGD